MIKQISDILKFQEITNVKCIHNELKILFEIGNNGPSESMKIMKSTGASISGHNDDIKRLSALKIIEFVDHPIDKRKRLYNLSPDIKNMLCESHLGNE